MTLHKKIRQIRTEKRRLAKESGSNEPGANWRYWTQTACAARAGITVESWNNMETGKHVPQLPKLRKAAVALETTLSVIVDEGSEA